jgi:hypothetical protein
VFIYALCFEIEMLDMDMRIPNLWVARWVGRDPDYAGRGLKGPKPMGWCAPSSLITVLMLAELDMSSTIELASAEAPTGAPSAYRLNLCPVCELPLIPRHVDDYCCKGHL